MADTNDDMELAYAHVRYQKSFEREENELRQQQYNQMKEIRQQRLKPLTSLGIKKFSKQYEKIRRNMYNQIHEERIKYEHERNQYVAPSLSKIGVECMQEEEKHKILEESKRSDRLNSNKIRDKYWVLVRDLHAPKISDSKKVEMEKLIEKVDNKRFIRSKNIERERK